MRENLKTYDASSINTRLERRVIVAVFSALAFLILFYLFEDKIHLLIHRDPLHMKVHLLLEILVLIITTFIAVQGWLIYPFCDPNKNLLFSALFFPISVFLFMHLIYIKGMPFYVNMYSSDISLWFSDFAKITEAIGILIIVVLTKPFKLRKGLFYSFIFAYVIAVITLIVFFYEYFPKVIFPIFGMTHITANLKFVLLFHSLALIKVIYDYKKNLNNTLLYLILALCFLVISDLSFVFQVQTTDVDNILGHVAKFIAYIFIFKTNYTATVVEPFIKKHESEKMNLENQQRLSWMIEQIPGAFHAVDDQLNITLANKTFKHLMGVSENDNSIIGENIVKVLERNGFDGDTVLCKLAYEGNKVFTKEKVRIGDYILHADVTPIYDPSTREPVGAVSYCFDITQEESENTTRERLLALYLKQSQNLHRLLESIPTAFLAVDRSGKVLFTNERLVSLLGFNNKGEIFGAELDFISNKIDIPTEDLYIYRALQGEEINNANVRLLDNDLLINSYPIKSQEGKIMGAISLYHDITELQSFRNEIENMERLNLVGQMAASITHEIRNPMATVRGFIQLIKENNDLANEYYDVIIDELDRANSIISDFLSLSRTRVLEMEEYNLNQIIKELYPILIAEANIRGQFIELRLAEQLPKLKVNRKEIKQLILNLSRNASEAMEQGGILTIETVLSESNQINLLVRDTGAGIPKEELSHLFRPFFTTKDGGTGLGLSVSRSIVEKHKGTIFVDSEVGEGTTFSIQIPI